MDVLAQYSALEKLFIGGLIIQLLIVGTFSVALWRSARERHQLSRELFGVLNKIDGLTASRREQILRHYDGVLGELAAQIPDQVGREAGRRIFETESRILTRLAELEPDLSNDPSSQSKMNELIEVMESLEITVSQIATTTVRDAMDEARRTISERLFHTRTSEPLPADD